MDNKNISNDEGYIWRFRIDDYIEAPSRLYSDNILEMLRMQIKNTLEVVVLSNNGVEVEISGFMLRSAPYVEYKLDT